MRLRLIFLAAGNSRRFGSNKLLYPVEGIPMYLHLLERLRALCQENQEWELLAVTRYPEILSACRQYQIPVVHSEESRKGASFSIKAGLLGQPGEEKPEAYIFFAADQPWLSKKTVREFLLFMEGRKSPLGFVSFRGEPGNPVWFGARFLPELLALEGDQGGRRVLRAHLEEAVSFPVEDPKELQDVDVPPENADGARF